MIEEKMRKTFECRCDNCDAHLGRGDTAKEAGERAKDKCIIVRWYGIDSWMERIFCWNCRAEAEKIKNYDPENRQLLVYGEEGADHENNIIL